ncbi:TMV resistance protein N-like [Pistacia vera]|uniref:TMV resistance protein N-like n=1 Tax=Pistacia vera TaxID=55513 RepID=UPI0012630B1B|nr:TMV resistance protein N-like [Pistacia vera]
MSIQTASSSGDHICSSRWKYDVFISFRGEDTRKNFTDHLYAALTQEGVNVFRDADELDRGKPISLELLRAIEESRFSIIVFSRKYANSSWCLHEIAKIVECKNTMGQNVFPIFYDVDPSTVRKQTGTFEEAFAKHDKENKQNVQIWRNALKEVADLSGWDAKNRHESELIHDIVKEISIKLSRTTLMTSEGLVGINSRLEELKLLIGTGSNDIRMIGIWGMGGIGKTTIARVFCDLFSDQFEGKAFLADVREISRKSGLVKFQSQLLGGDTNICNEYDGIKEIKRKLPHKKVLVVVDDVDHIDQLNNLVGKHEWFGLGSRIIITTRDKHLLTTHEVDEVYEAKELNCDEALELFISKAFKNQQPSKVYLELSQHVVSYAGRLPLALKVLGSFLFGRIVDEWTDTLKRLKRDPKKEILDVLEISFDGLEETDKKIFLDIACSFKRQTREYVTRILDGCGFNPTIGLSVLLERSLITISDYNEIGMHDLLQEMGRQIVKRESIKEPGKRSRLWDEEDIRHVLTTNTGTELVEAITLETEFGTELNVNASAKAFSKMTNLRLLKIRGVQLPKGLEYLSNQLRLLDWHGFPLESLPSNLQLNKLVELKMDGSRIRQPWKVNKRFNMLKSISFSFCESLIKTPDFTEIPNLEELTLRGCSRLNEIHPSLLAHEKIKNMDLAYCLSLETLPSQIHMESLRYLNLRGCSKLKRFPEIIGSMECLFALILYDTAIKELPLSIGLLSRLEFLDLGECKNLSSLPSTINDLKSLWYLSISHCSRLVSLPSTIDDLKSLCHLSISHCLSLILANLCRVTKLYLRDCNLGDGAITSDLLGSFISLEELDLSQNNFVSLPTSINRLSNLRNLSLNYCRRLQILPELPSNISELSVSGCISLERLSNALRLCNSNLSKISSHNCLKLDGSGEAFSIMKEHLKLTNSSKRLAWLFQQVKFQVVQHKSDGDSIKIKSADLQE